MTLARLIEAVEAGDIDGLIAAIKPMRVAAHDNREIFHGHDIEKAFSGSLDAAKRLHDALLPGWFPGLSQNVHNGFWFAWVETKDGRYFSATEADPARAFLLAILRAMEGRDG